MLSFESDYIEGACDEILQKLMETNREQLSGYGMDHYCKSAAEKIAEACQCPEAQVYFLTGGTQTNQIVIDTMLKPYEGVMAAESGHVTTHEAGAIEHAGHKVLALPEHQGKVHAEDVKKYLETFYGDGNHEHMVFPGMLYISHPTEFATLYTKQELKDLSEICHQYDIPLYLDGARLGYGLAAKDTDVTLADVAKYADVFYIGGTKVGALCGEAVVFTKNNMPKYFATMVKQHGAMLAKGRVLGIQFDTLFTDGLYYRLGENGIRTGEKLKALFREKGYKFHMENPTNQIFIVLEDEKMEELKKHVAFGFWEKADETHTVVRFCTGWATTDEAIDRLAELL